MCLTSWKLTFSCVLPWLHTQSWFVPNPVDVCLTPARPAVCVWRYLRWLWLVQSNFNAEFPLCSQFVALWAAHYRKNRQFLKQNTLSGDQEELVPKSRISRYDSQLADVGDHVLRAGGELSVGGGEPDGKSIQLAARLNEDRLITVCEQLSDLRLMIKRLENQQAGIQMPKVKSNKAPKTPKQRNLESVPQTRHAALDFSSPFAPPDFA